MRSIISITTIIRSKLFLINRTVIGALFILATLLFYYRDVVFRNHTFLIEHYASGTMPASVQQGPYGYPGILADNTSPPVKDPGAVAWITEPSNHLANELIKDGEVPLWKPYTGMGAPFLADGLDAPLEPLNLLFSLAPSVWWPAMMDIQVLVRFFLAGLFTFLFANRIGVRGISAVFASIAFMLSDYFVMFGNHQQMRPEVLLPFVLYCFECLVQNPSKRNMALCGLGIAWVIISGMPEAGFMTLSIGIIWYLTRGISQIRLGEFTPKVLITIFVQLLLVMVFGIGLSAFYLLPLGENVFSSITSHVAGTTYRHFPGWAALFTILPNTLTPTVWWAPHFSIIVIFTALIGLFNTNKSKRLRLPAYFFLVYFVIFTLRMYGSPIVQWMSLLPFYNQIWVDHYAGPSIAYCLSLLAAIGLDHVLTKGISVYGIIFVDVILAAFVLFLYKVIPIPFAYDHRKLYISALFVIGFLVVIEITAWVFSYLKMHQIWLGGVFLCLLIIETTTWQINIHRPLRYYPYTIPPFIHYLNDQSDPYRIFSPLEILVPNIAMAYRLDDIRYLDAIDSSRRSTYYRQLIAPNAPHDRVVGQEKPFYWGKFFDLLNTKYILTTTDKPVSTSFRISEIPDAVALLNRGNILLHSSELDINGITQKTIFMHPPSELSLPIQLPSSSIRLNFGIGVDPQVWMSEPLLGDGVNFIITLIDDKDSHLLFSQYIDPKHSITDQKWFNYSIDLSQWSGKTVILTLATDGGLSGDSSNDWAHWSDPFFTVENEPSYWDKQFISQDVISLTQSSRNQGYVWDYSVFKINGDYPGDKISFSTENDAEFQVHIPDGELGLRFTPCVNIDALPFGKDGKLSFRVMLQDDNGETTLYNNLIDSSFNNSNHCLADEKISLSNWRGQTILLKFAVSPKDNQITAGMLAYWKDVKLIGEGVGIANPEINRFKLVYDKEIQIFQNTHAFPRAFVVYKAEIADGINDALSTLQKPGFDPSSEVVIEKKFAAKLTSNLILNEANPDPSPAKVIKRTTSSMLINTNLVKPGILVISESYFPGWYAYVDDHRTDIFPVDIFLRGVFLESGTHDVYMVYQPMSFKLGVLVSIVSLFGILFLIFGDNIIKRNLNKDYRVETLSDHID